MSRCKYPGCTYEGDERPYSRNGVPSVTSICSFANIDDKARSFAWAAAEIAATTAMHLDGTGVKPSIEECSQSHKVEPGLCRSCKMIRSEFDRRWGAKSALGQHIHHLAVSWAQGEQVVSDPVTDLYLDSLEGWYKCFEPKWQHLERTIDYDCGDRHYVGTFDAIASIECPLNHTDNGGEPQRCTWLLDIKTGEGRYEIEWALQLAAYRHAHHITAWDEEGHCEKELEMPPVDHTGIIQLQADGTVAPLIWVSSDTEIHDHFLQLLDVMQWTKKRQKEIKDAKRVPRSPRKGVGSGASGDEASSEDEG